MTNNKRKGIPAAAFMAAFSTPRYEHSVNTEKPSKFSVVERWDGQKWIELRLEWNGAEYKEVR